MMNLRPLCVWRERGSIKNHEDKLLIIAIVTKTDPFTHTELVTLCTASLQSDRPSIQDMRKNGFNRCTNTYVGYCHTSHFICREEP